MLRWASPERVQDLPPRPDAVEYDEAARRLGRGEGYWLHLAGERHPPRYPFGFSLLLAPAVSLWGDERPGVGIWVVLATAAAGIAATWGLARGAGGVLAGTAAALLLATAPLHVRYSKAILSDVPATAALAGVGWLAVRAAARSGQAGGWVLVGAATSLAATIRMPTILLLAPLGGFLLFGRSEGHRRWCDTGGLLAGALAGILPLLLHHWHRFGSPLATGYGYWLRDSLFGLEHFFGPPAAGGTEPNALFYGAALLGRGELYPWPVAALAAWGVVAGARRPGAPRMLVLLTLGLGGALYVLQGFFFWQGERFLLLVVPLVAATASLPLAPSAGRLVRGGALLGVLLALGLAVRGHSYAPPDRDWGEVAALRALASRIERNAVVLARTTSMLFERFLRDGDADRLWIPLRSDEWQRRIRLQRLTTHGRVADGGWLLAPVDSARRPGRLTARLHALLDGGRPVYVLTVRSFDVPFFSQLLATLRTEFVLTPRRSAGRWPVLRVGRRVDRGPRGRG